MYGVEWNDIVGAVGVVLILGSYLLLQIGSVRSESLKYSVANAAGAGMIAISLLIDFNFYALVVEISWLLISLVGIVRSIGRRRRPVEKHQASGEAAAD